MTELAWLPEVADWRRQLKALPADPEAAWNAGIRLANARLDFLQTNLLDSAMARALGGQWPVAVGEPIRLALLGSCTTTHLPAGIRMAALRRNIAIEIYESTYGQYLQELSNRDSALHAFRPAVVLLVLDAHHLTAGVHADFDENAIRTELASVEARIQECWRLALEAFRCPIIQQTVMPVHPPLMGNNEHRLPGSRSALVATLNQRLRVLADAAGVDLLAVHDRAHRDGVKAWFDPSLWYRAKQEVSPVVAPLYGDLVVRIIAARIGKSFKCLVLDLDNTLWGGVLGDDGLDGLILGQGSGVGEAYAAFQQYARSLSQRGILLAVCSKNEEAVAFQTFDSHPDMVLNRSDIACFVANWDDKATNLKRIAQQLNIGVDSLVFVDDNAFERALIREALPMVAVPEVSDDPTYNAEILAAAGYFEAVAITQDDRVRGSQYQDNLQREVLRASASDLTSYLRSLQMQLRWRAFDRRGLARIVQLINKTNQFNLTSRRYTDQDVLSVMNEASTFGLQLRLVDRLGDNGIIAIVIGKMQDEENLLIDTWLMSCRVLGRQIEAATLNLIVEQARRLKARRLVGEYVPTSRNAVVRDHYAKLGFTEFGTDATGNSRAVLELDRFTPRTPFIEIQNR